MRVLMTQIGFVMSTVALPARAPAIMDSTVVSRLETRPARMAARSKAARVHSYPIERGGVSASIYVGIWGGRGEVYSSSRRNW